MKYITIAYIGGGIIAYIWLTIIEYRKSNLRRKDIVTNILVGIVWPLIIGVLITDVTADYRYDNGKNWREWWDKII